MRNRIKHVATQMLTHHGYRGFRFQHVADALGITRGNIHYHFGDKRRLAEEVLTDYVDELLAILDTIWNDPQASLRDKVNRTMLSNRERYLKFNPGGETANPWSLTARMRLDRTVLSPPAKASLAKFTAELERLITEGVRMSVEDGSLRADAPVDRIAFQLVMIFSSSDPITQDTGGFDRLAQLYDGFLQIIEHAYGAHALEPATGERRRAAS